MQGHDFSFAITTLASATTFGCMDAGVLPVGRSLPGEGGHLVNVPSGPSGHRACLCRSPEREGGTSGHFTVRSRSPSLKIFCPPSDTQKPYTVSAANASIVSADSMKNQDSGLIVRLKVGQ